MKFNYSLQEKKTLRSMFMYSGLASAAFNVVKMQGNCFCCTMSAAIDELYTDPEERSKALVRHDSFFNTHAVMLAFIAGLTYALEREKTTKGNVDDDTIESIKVSLMGPTAGIGDSIFFNCVRVIAAGIAIGFCSQGNILGTLLFILIYGGSQLLSKWFLLRIGYSMGTRFIDEVFTSGLMEPLTKAASILGLSMVGAMVATMVNVKLAWTINIGETSVVLLDIVNSIMPGILSIILVFGLVALIKKGVRPVTMVIGILAASLVLAALGIF
ncbi:PTS system mannose/fructose/sorbose family transporter subunit IID [Holdemania massiliensis]|uniref:PTS system mannose/fructose/sorbose family transporter subunit IID n=1 Tax=Holdemania massiliensis TaxID=1468449 RepID=UPI001F067330|nr:PTS system mannose/fructose/sorbose family transporter subunit IID [Holdemania massiliensis]MCH1942648.1 PTS system mannose/fructose/sorbose family transporter subunit IID [Holdemania massiliensis]